MNWAMTLLEHTDVLQAYEEGLQEQDPGGPPPTTNTDPKQGEKPATPKTTPKTTTENRNTGKEKMQPMARQTPDPLKQMRQKQAEAAKLLAAQNRQREGIRKEQERIRAVEAEEKKANADRIAKRPNPVKAVKEDNPLAPISNLESDPEILPDTPALEKDTTQEGDAAEISEFTLTDEGEGDNISGNKELRGETEHEDESNSKRLKQPLNPNDPV
jgi:hypothetical protein